MKPGTWALLWVVVVAAFGVAECVSNARADERSDRIEVSRQLRLTQASLRHTRRVLSNARDLHPTRAGRIMGKLEDADTALMEAQGELTRGRAEDE